MNKKIIPVVLWLCAQSAHALDLLGSYQAALANDPTWRATLSSYLANQQNEGIAYGALLPSVGLSGSINRNRFEPDQARLDTTLYTAKQLGLSARQPLFRPDLWAKYEQAKIASDVNDADLQAKQQDFVLRVSEAYFQVLQAQATLEALGAEERALDRQNTMMQARFNAGLIAKTDVTEALAQYQTAKANRLAGEVAVTTAKENLSAIIGQPVDQLATLREDVGYQSVYPADMQSWEGMAKTRHPQVVLARYQYQAAQKNRDTQASNHLPKLDLVGSAGINKQGLDSQKFNDGERYSIGLELNLPLYTGGQTTLAVRQANYQVDAAFSQIQAAERQVVAQARSAYLNLQADQAKLGARQDAVKSGEIVAQASQVGYELGVRNIVDVLLAQRNAFAARRDYVSARYDYVLNVIRLRAAAGQLSANDLSEINQWLTDAPQQSTGRPKTGTALDLP